MMMNNFLRDLIANHNHNKILKSDWLSIALISALIGQFNRVVTRMDTAKSGIRSETGTE